jgi:hypothetical protein
MWPFSTRQERQAAEMAQLLAENSYERKMERVAGWIRTFAALLVGVSIAFGVLVFAEVSTNMNPTDVWSWLIKS